MENQKPRILVISSNFSPEETGIAVYSTDLAEKILAADYDVTVLTGLPHYPWWEIPERHSHHVPGHVHADGYKLMRISHAVPSSSGAIGRGLLEFSFWRNGRKQLKDLKNKEFDLVVAIMPTLACGAIARYLAKKHKLPGVVIFQDVTSLGALQSGMPGARLVYRIARILEIRASSWASKVITVSEEMARVVGEILKKRASIKVIHNYSVFQPSPIANNQARSQLDAYQGKYLVLHTGNIGYKQDLLNVAAAAQILESKPNIHILIVGHGNQEEILKNNILGKPNISMIPFVSSEDYPIYLAAADALLVNERATLKEMSLPSKLTSYLASGRPVIAAISPQSATSKFLKDAALVTEPGNPKALAEAVLLLQSDPELQIDLSKRGLKFAADNLSATSGRQKYLDVIKEVLGKI